MQAILSTHLDSAPILNQPHGASYSITCMSRRFKHYNILPGREGLKGGAPSKLLKGLFTDKGELDVTPFEGDHASDLKIKKGEHYLFRKILGTLQCWYSKKP